MEVDEHVPEMPVAWRGLSQVCTMYRAFPLPAALSQPAGRGSHPQTLTRGHAVLSCGAGQEGWQVPRSHKLAREALFSWEVSTTRADVQI